MCAPPNVIKRFEVIAKSVLALFLAALFFRPGRRRRARERIQRARRVLLVRIDNRVGEALLTTPLFDALAERGGFEVHVLVHQKAARVLDGHPHVQRVIPFDRRRLFLGPFAPGIAPLRAEAYDAVVDCSNWTAPSVTAAIVSRLVGGSSAVVGPGLLPVSPLQDVPVRARADTRDEVAQRLHLLSPLVGESPRRALSFRAPRSGEGVQRFAASLIAPFGVVNPGGRLGIRRVAPEAFAAAARAMRILGVTPVVTYGPGEEALAAEVARAAPGSVVAPPTTIDELAWLMKSGRVTVCNNTGPMHLSVAVGTPTLAFFLRMEMARWGHDHAPHRMVDLTPAVDGGGDLVAEAERVTTAFVRELLQR